MKVNTIASIGTASISAASAHTFDFSSTPGGNAIILSCEQGGLFRVNVDGNAAQTTIGTIDTEDFFVFCDAGNVSLEFPVRQTTDRYITTVKVYAYSAAVNVGCSLAVL